jgi:16S rRNA (guanine527-N7)-methyltransferase
MTVDFGPVAERRVRSDVSRETPAAPDTAQRVFASRLDLAVRYADLLATEGTLRGLIGPREVPRLWDRHLLNCALLADAMPARAEVCDVGSGAGLPGLVLAIRRPDLSLTLVEPLLRRTTFLEQVVAELGLDNVHVVRARADALHGTRLFAVVTSRAVAPLGRLLEWSMPLVAPDGVLIAMKGTSVQAEIDHARAVLATLGCADPEVIELGGSGAQPPTFAVRVAWADPGRVSSDGFASSVARSPSRSRSRKPRGRKKS